MEQGSGTWAELATHVLSELKRLNANLEQLNKDHVENRQAVWIEIANIKSRQSTMSAAYGLMGGALAVIPTLVVIYLAR